MSTRCPAWCVVDHATKFAFDLEVGFGLCESASMPVELDATQCRPARRAAVRVSRVINLDGTVDPTTVSVFIRDPDDLTPADARRLAAALVYAAELADAEHRAVTR